MLYYIHGYESSPDGEKARLFKKELNAVPVQYRDCPPEKLIIADCLARIADVIRDDREVALIGSSLGGFLASAVALRSGKVKQMVLLNPAILPPAVDISGHTTVPHRILQEMKEERFFTQRLGPAITIIRGTEDDIIPLQWNIAFAMAQEAVVHFLHDDHRLSRHLQQLPAIIAPLVR